MEAAEDGGGITGMTMIDEKYEFSAPKFYDFAVEESEEDMKKAELWFEAALSYAPSPFMPKIKTGRSLKVEALCDFSEAAEQSQKVSESSDSTASINPSNINSESEVVPPSETREGGAVCRQEKEKNGNLSRGEEGRDNSYSEETKSPISVEFVESEPAETNVDGKVNTCCTPKLPVTSQKESLMTNSKKHQSAKRIASMVKNPSSLKPKNHSQHLRAKGSKPESAKRPENVQNVVGKSNLAQENQAVKKQKLEGGAARQILSLKPPQQLHHKSKLGVCNNNTNPSHANTKKEERKVYVRETERKPFVSMAEMMKKFQSSTRDLSLPSSKNNSISHGKAPLSLTRPQEPEFETSQRVRTVKIKSTAELEEEMMTKIPKFKARPLNKKILEAPSLPAIPRSTPQLPEFQEFHFKTAARANQKEDSVSVTSTHVSNQKHDWKPHHLTEPKPPLLHTTLRARPPKVKSSIELEKEALEKIPKFKARPLNKKIFESKGEMGISCNPKKQVTIPKEFHFAIDERIPPPALVVDIFDKLSLNSEPCHDNPLPKRTKPNPFHLHTEERGAEKERKLLMDLVQKQMEEEQARVPRANPYPYTTDYPVVPPKPEPKPVTKPEPFPLESLQRHEEEMRREMEERQRIEREEAEKRKFKAQPILKEDPIPLPEKVRKPLTQVQQFSLQVENRAIERAEFDQKVKEKEQLYKRYREESEAARMIEEERAVKQMRRTMVPHARPVPSFEHPFCPKKSSKGVTKPKSPNLRVLRRKEKQRIMMVNPAASSPASCMR